MPCSMQFQDVLCLGTGKTGLAVARCARSLSGTGSVVVYGGDGHFSAEAQAELESIGCEWRDGSCIQGSFDVCVASPGIPEHSDFFQAGKSHAKRVISEPEFAFEVSPERWIGITGTNGKTTTTALTAALLNESGIAARAVGNIGACCSDAVVSRGNEWFVAELSSYQLAPIDTFHPKRACLLNITPDHLSWHGSFEAYTQAKLRLFENMRGDDLAVIGSSVAHLAEDLAKRMRVVVVDAQKDPKTERAAFVRDGCLVVRSDFKGSISEVELVAVDELQLAGRHNVEDALCAATLALDTGAHLDAVCRGLKAFQALEHRIEPCGVIYGIRYINDSKATNPDAVIQALRAFEAQHIILLVGGHDKGVSFAELSDACCKIKAAVCFGEAGSRLAAELNCPCVEQKNLAHAFGQARALAQAGDVILLSPACSSFDEFSSFEERGLYFKQLVASAALRT